MNSNINAQASVVAMQKGWQDLTTEAHAMPRRLRVAKGSPDPPPKPCPGLNMRSRAGLLVSSTWKEPPGSEKLQVEDGPYEAAAQPAGAAPPSRLMVVPSSAGTSL